MAIALVRFKYWFLSIKLRVCRILGTKWGNQRVMGRDFFFSDPTLFVQTFKSIFVDERYFFKTQNKHPLIIDCGSSFGLSAAYFRYLYPEATIISFETKQRCWPLSQFIRKPVDLVRLDFRGSEAEVLEELSTSSRMAMVRELFVEFRHDLERDQSLSVVLKALRTYQVKFQSSITDNSVQDMLIQAKRRPHVSVKNVKRAIEIIS